MLPAEVFPVVNAPSDVMFEVDDMLLLLSDVVSVLVESGVSYIIPAMRPLAENVDPSAAVEVWLSVPVAFPVPAVEVVLSVVPPVLVLFGAVYCATAGARLYAAAKSPKTRTNATAMGALFIGQSVQERILTIISIM